VRRDFYHQTSTLITGASSGLGEEFARQLAPDSARLVLSGRNQAALEKLAGELREKNPALQVEVWPADLATDAGQKELCDRLRANPVSILINNAGLGDYGAFADSFEEKNHELLAVNVVAVSRLAHAFLQRKAGSVTAKGILNVSSLAASMPIPDFALYAASKSFVTSFSEALRLELRTAGIHVTAHCPGPVATNFGDKARRQEDQDFAVAKRDLLRVTKETAISAALNGLAANRPRVFPGWRVRLASLFFEILPRPLLRLALKAIPRT
jgi:uncharacterized protein